MNTMNFRNVNSTINEIRVVIFFLYVFIVLVCLVIAEIENDPTSTLPTTTLQFSPSALISSSTIRYTEKADLESIKITTFMPTLNNNSVTKITNTKNTIRYDGDQVLRVFTVNSKHRKKIKELERDGSEYYILPKALGNSSNNYYFWFHVQCSNYIYLF